MSDLTANLTRDGFTSVSQQGGTILAERDGIRYEISRRTTQGTDFVHVGISFQNMTGTLSYQVDPRTRDMLGGTTSGHTDLLSEAREHALRAARIFNGISPTGASPTEPSPACIAVDPRMGLGDVARGVAERNGLRMRFCP